MTKSRFTIFLASSRELAKDRILLGAHIGELDASCEQQYGVRVCLKKWEDFPSYYTIDHTQNAYNYKIRESQLVVALFRTRFGKYTQEELEVAIAERKKVLVFVKSEDGTVAPAVRDGLAALGISDYAVYSDISEVEVRFDREVQTELAAAGPKQAAKESYREVLRICIHMDEHPDIKFDGKYLTDAFRGLSDIYEHYGIRLRTTVHEDDQKGIFITLLDGGKGLIDSPTHQKIDREIRQYARCRKPLVFFYVRNRNPELLERIEQEYKHFADVYEQAEMLKLYVVTQLQLLDFGSGKLPSLHVSDRLYLDQEPILNLADMDFIRNNATIRDLIARAHELKNGIDDLLGKDSIDKLGEDRDNELLAVRSEMSKIHAEICFLVERIVGLFGKIQRCRAENSLENMQQMQADFLAGNYDAVKRRLDELFGHQADFLREADAERLALNERYLQYFRFYDMYRDLVLVSVGGDEGYRQACEKYEEEILQTGGNRLFVLDRAALFLEYAGLRNKHRDDCLEQYERCLEILDFADKELTEEADLIRGATMRIECLTEMGWYYWLKKDFRNTSRCYRRAFKCIDPAVIHERYRLALATLYDNWGLLLVEQATNAASVNYAKDKIREAIRCAYDKAAAIYEGIDDLSADAGNELASIYSNIGRAFWELYKRQRREKWFERSLEKLERAVEIRSEIMYSMPSLYEPSLVFPVNNLGELYTTRGLYTGDRSCFEKAGAFFREGIERLERHVSYNIHYYGPRIAGIRARLALIHACLGDFEQAAQTMHTAKREMVRYTKNDEKYVYRLEELEEKTATLRRYFAEHGVEADF